MKNFLLLVIAVLICSSCKQKENEELVADPDATDQIASVSESIEESVPIPSYNFEQFQALYRNQPDEVTYVINFWATWCKPCIKELPAFELINDKYKDQGVKVVLVSLDLPDLLENQVIPFVEQKGLQAEVVLLDDPDANTWIPLVAEQWSGAIPATLLIKGDQEKFYERSFTFEEIETELKTIL